MIIEQEKYEHEAIKAVLKQAIQNNPNLDPFQKKTAMDNIDRAAQQADWIIEMLRMCEYLG